MKIFKTVFLMFSVLSTISVHAFAMDVYTDENITITPIKHATMVIQSGPITIFVDPVGEQTSFARFPQPDFILLTDIHRDHLAPELINTLKDPKTKLIGPQAVIDKLGGGTVLDNGEEINFAILDIKAVPMYNLSEQRLKFHKKGRGNGYILTMNKKRVYVSGDTEDIREMRNLKKIDYAFVCMNLPYTMTVDQAASAVLEFKPQFVFPYHYRGKAGYSDVQKFKNQVNKNKNINVVLLNWYKE